MGIFKFLQEHKAHTSHKRLFKAVMIEHANVLPKASPFIKSIETVQGDGGVGSIIKTNFSDGKYMKNKIDHLDPENCVGKLTLVEGDVLGDKVESISYEVKFEDSKDGGCVVKISAEYHTKGGAVIKEEDVKESKEQSIGLYKAYADYLNANPHVCA